MGEDWLWTVLFATAALGGMGALILLQKSAIRDALHVARKAFAEERAWLAMELTEGASALARATLRLAKSEEEKSLLRDELRDRDTRIEERDAQIRDRENRISELTGFRANAEGLRARLDEMKAVWLDHAEQENSDNEADCQRILARNKWILAPDYVVDENFFVTPRSLGNAFATHFPQSAMEKDWNGGNSSRWRVQISDLKQPDLCGWTRSHSAFEPARDSDSPPEDIYLIIELKSSRKPVSWDHIEQVHAYAFALMQNVGATLRSKRIDCLVIGKQLENGVNDAHLRWGEKPHHAIRIIPLTYRQLYERARCMAEPFLAFAFRDPPVAPGMPDSVNEPAEKNMTLVDAA